MIKQLKDRKIEIKGFDGNKIIVRERKLWCEVLIEERYCEECENGSTITIHKKDINKLIRALRKMGK